MKIALCGLYLQPMTKGVLEEKFVSEFFCPYFIGNLHAVTEHGEVVVKGVFAVNLLPDGLTGCNAFQNLFHEKLEKVRISTRR